MRADLSISIIADTAPSKWFANFKHDPTNTDDAKGFARQVVTQENLKNSINRYEKS